MPMSETEKLLPVGQPRLVVSSEFANHRDAAAWVIRMGRALRRSNGPLAPHISRRDNNANWDDGWRLIACGKRIAEKYGDETKEDRLKARLQAALSRHNASRVGPPDSGSSNQSKTH